MEIQVIEAIIPTIVVPFAFLGFIISAAAAAIASLFGIQLKTEGPRRLLEVLLKPRVIVAALIMNAVIWGGYNGYQYWKHAPSPLFYIKAKNPALQDPMFTHRPYEDTNRHPEIDNGFLPKLEITDFELVWEKDYATGFFNQPTLSGPSLFVGNKDGATLEIDAESGEVLREFFSGTHVTPASVVWRDFLFTGEGVHDTHHGRIYKFSLRTGELLGAFTSKGHTQGTPLMVEEDGRAVLLVASGRDGVSGVDPESMQEVWNIREGHVDSGFAKDGGVAFFSTGVEKHETHRQRQYVYAVDAFAGEVLWKKEIPISAWMPPLVVEDEVCIGLGEIYWESDYGQLACYDKMTGKPTWSVNHGRPIASQLSRRGKFIAFADMSGSLCLVEREQRKMVWCRKTSSEVLHSYSSPVFLDDERIAFAAKDSGLYVFDVRGRELAHWTTPNWENVYARVGIFPQGWYVATYTGKIFRLKPVYREMGLSMRESRRRQ